MQLAGEEDLNRPIDAVWAALSDPAFLVQCFPGVDEIVRTDEKSAEFRVRPGFSFVRGTLDVSFEFTERTRPSHAAVAIRVRGIGSSAELGAEMHLEPSDAGTRVNWSAESRSFGGLLKAVSQGLLQAAAQRVATDTWSSIRERMGST